MSRRTMILKVSSEMMMALLADGKQLPRHGKSLIVKSGVPADAVLVDISNQLFFDTNYFALKFESPSIPEVPPSHFSPVVELKFEECDWHPREKFLDGESDPQALIAR